MKKIRSLIIKDILVTLLQLKSTAVFWVIFSLIGFLMALSVAKGNLAILYQTEQEYADGEFLMMVMELSSAAMLSLVFIYPVYQYSSKWRAFQFASPVNAHENAVSKLLPPLMIFICAMPVSVGYTLLIKAVWPVQTLMPHTAAVICLVSALSVLVTFCCIATELLRSEKAAKWFIICASLLFFAVFSVWFYGFLDDMGNMAEKNVGVTDMIEMIHLDILQKILPAVAAAVMVGGYFLMKVLYGRRGN